MACQYTLEQPETPMQLAMQRFGYLGNSDVIRHWFQRGWQMRDADAQNCFEPFILTWIALNAWGECVTGEERDQIWVRALARDKSLNQVFSDYLNGAVQQPAADRFRSRWPIPLVQAWRRHDPLQPNTNSPQDRARFFAEHKIPFEPACSLQHFDRGEQIPLDWEHFLPATYRVRCNLFHGEKSPYDPVDAEIVCASFQMLVGFMDRLGHFSCTRPNTFVGPLAAT